MTTTSAETLAHRPSRARQTLQVWLAVVPTICVLQWLLHDLLAAFPVPVRPPVIASIAIPLVVYAVMPLQQALIARGRSSRTPARG